MVIIHLHTLLQIKTDDGLLRKVVLPFAPGMTLASVVDALDLAIDEAHVMLVVNGQQAGLERVLSDGDEIHLIPALSGG